MDFTDLVKRLRVCKDDCAKCSMLYEEQVEQDLVREHCAAYEAADAIETLVSYMGEYKAAYIAEHDARMADYKTDKDRQAAQKWIPVTKRLPENEQDIIAYMDDGEESRIIPCNYSRGVWFDCMFDKKANHITHWMPLPEPPKEANDG